MLDDHTDFLNSEFDLHVLTGALKMFFRELKEPLFPFNTFDKFMNAISKCVPTAAMSLLVIIKLLAEQPLRGNHQCVWFVWNIGYQF